MKVGSFIGQQGMKFGAVANSKKRQPSSLKLWLKAVETEQMVEQELGQGQRQMASISLGTGLC